MLPSPVGRSGEVLYNGLDCIDNSMPAVIHYAVFGRKVNFGMIYLSGALIGNGLAVIAIRLNTDWDLFDGQGFGIDNGTSKWIYLV